MPRTYVVTRADGKEFEMDWEGDGEPSLSDVEQAFKGQMAAPEADEGPGLLGRTLDVVGRVGQTLNRVTGGATLPVIADEIADTVRGRQGVGQALSDTGQRIKDAYTPTGLGTWKENPDFNQVLENQGVEEGLKPILGDKGADWATAGLGFAGDVFIDPLRVNAVNKAFGKGIGKLGEGVGAVGNKLMDNPIGRPIQAAAKEAFVPEYEKFRGLKGRNDTVDFADRIRLENSAQRAAREGAVLEAEQVFKNPAETIPLFGSPRDFKLAQTKAFAHAMDQGTGVPKGMESAQEAWQKTFDQVWQEKQAMGTTRKLKGYDEAGEPIWDELAKQKNYVTYYTKGGREMDAVVGPATNVLNKTDKARTGYETLKDAAEHGGALEDAREIMALSLTAHRKSQRTFKFMNELKNDFGQATPGPGLKKFDRANIGVPDQMWEVEGLKDMYFPEEIVDYVSRAVKLWEKPSELDNLWKTGTKLFKAGATSLNFFPHQSTNFMGNVMNMHVAGGMTLPKIASKIKQSYDVLREGKFPSIGGYSGDELAKFAKEYEIIGTSGHLQDLAEAGTRDKLVNNPLFATLRKKGTEWVEEPARLALWMDGLENGMSPAQAAIKVKNVLIDYAELTPTEQKIRDFGVPFFTWMRKNPGIQAKSLVDDPAKMNQVADFQNLFWNAEKEQVDQTVIPEAMNERGMLPSPLTNEAGTLNMMRLALPQSDLNMLTRPLQTIVDALHPALKLPAEFVMNQKTNGAPVATPTGFSTPSGLASLVSLMPDQIENLIPDALQGYVNTVNVGGRPRQRDIAAWLTGTVPTGMYGSVPKSGLDDPLSPKVDQRAWENILRTFGMGTDPLSGQDQEFEAQRRMKAEQRAQRMKSIVMER